MDLRVLCRQKMMTGFKTFIVGLRHVLWNFILYYFILVVGAIREAPGQLNWLAPASLYFAVRHFNFKKILK